MCGVGIYILAIRKIAIGALKAGEQVLLYMLGPANYAGRQRATVRMNQAERG